MTTRENDRLEWKAGSVPVSVILLSLNEAHNMGAVLDNLRGWAQEVFLVDSHSQDATVDIALRHGVHVVQRRFRGFSDQWNFALRELPISAPWTMKLDPDERISETLRTTIRAAIAENQTDALIISRRLWFMGKCLPITQPVIRVWRTGTCRFTEVEVNEHPVVHGRVSHVGGTLEHHDSPNLEHWLNKQNKYTTAEALSAFERRPLAAEPRLRGDSLQRRMWLKRHYQKVPFRYIAMFLYHYLALGAWRAGWVGYAWSRLRSDVYRLTEYKLREMRLTGTPAVSLKNGPGSPNGRVRQYE